MAFARDKFISEFSTDDPKLVGALKVLEEWELTKPKNVY